MLQEIINKNVTNEWLTNWLTNHVLIFKQNKNMGEHFLKSVIANKNIFCLYN